MLEEAVEVGDGAVPLCKSFMHVHVGIRAEKWMDDLPPQCVARSCIHYCTSTLLYYYTIILLHYLLQ